MRYPTQNPFLPLVERAVSVALSASSTKGFVDEQNPATPGASAAIESGLTRPDEAGNSVWGAMFDVDDFDESNFS